MIVNKLKSIISHLLKYLLIRKNPFYLSATMEVCMGATQNISVSGL